MYVKSLINIEIPFCNTPYGGFYFYIVFVIVEVLDVHSIY